MMGEKPELKRRWRMGLAAIFWIVAVVAVLGALARWNDGIPVQPLLTAPLLLAACWAARRNPTIACGLLATGWLLGSIQAVQGIFEGFRFLGAPRADVIQNEILGNVVTSLALPGILSIPTVIALRQDGWRREIGGWRFAAFGVGIAVVDVVLLAVLGWLLAEPVIQMWIAR